MKQKCLSIIIVNYMNYSLTQKCINSVEDTVKDIDYEIIVIDNCSPNESYDVLSKSNAINDKVIVYKNEKNNGFGFGNNVGAYKAKGEYLLFLNPDIVILNDAIEKMLNAIKADESIGLVSGQLLNTDSSIQYSCRRVIPIAHFIACRTPFSKIVIKKYKKKYNDIYLMKEFDHNSRAEVEWVMGACMMMKRTVFLEVGGFSKEYFMYFEDVDLCCKVRKLGKKVLYLPEAKMIHLHSQESIKSFNKMSVVHFKSMWKFYYKYYANKF